MKCFVVSPRLSKFRCGVHIQGMKGFIAYCKREALYAYGVMRLRGGLPRCLCTAILAQHFAMQEVGCWLCLRRFRMDIRARAPCMFHKDDDNYPYCGPDCYGLHFVPPLERRLNALDNAVLFGWLDGLRAATQRSLNESPAQTEAYFVDAAKMLGRSLDEMRWSLMFLQQLMPPDSDEQFFDGDRWFLRLPFPPAAYRSPYQALATEIQAFYEKAKRKDAAARARSQYMQIQQQKKEQLALRARIIAEERDRERERRHLTGRGRRRGK